MIGFTQSSVNIPPMNLQLCTYGNPVLRKKAEPVQAINESVHALADEMIAFMHAERGVGLAAEQIGRTEALCVIDIPPDADTNDDGLRENPEVAMPLVLINPEITARSPKRITCEEGCLSFPGLAAPVERHYQVTVRFTGLDGTERELTGQGLLARAIQHELDHLNGVLLVDRMSPVKRIAYAGRLKRMVRETKAAMRD
jgi:peptide deformylase